MSKTLRSASPPYSEHALLISTYALVAGILFSPFIISVGSVALFLLFVYHSIKHYPPGFISRTLVLLILILILVYGLASFYSEDKLFAWLKFKNKLSLGLIALPLLSMKFGKRVLEPLLFFFTILLFLSTFRSLYALINLDHPLADIYRKGQVLPTIVNHVRYSLLIAFGILCCIYLLFTQRQQGRSYKILLSFVAVWLLVFLHLLAVRSGLIAFYLSVIAGSVYLAVVYRSPVKLFVFLLTGSMLFLIAVRHVPSLNAKWNYTVYSLRKFSGGQVDQSLYSDPVRLASMKLGIMLIRKNPITGVGTGDLPEEMSKLYRENYPDFPENMHALPHNQYIYTYASTGLVGFVVVVLMSAYLLIYFLIRRNLLFFSFNVIMISSFLTESTIEHQLGTTVFILFNALGFNQTQPYE